MSPEQAVGKTADRRSDLWSFGVVLYEMLTGRALFTGETVSHVLAEVLKTDPDWTTLPDATPAPIRRLLRRCLERDRKQRLADAADARLDIDEAIASPGEPAPLAASPRASWASRLPWAVVALVVIGVGAAAVLRSGLAPPSATRLLRVSVVHAGGRAVTPVLSPDGDRVVYVAPGPDARPSLWVRELDEPGPTVLAGTEEARNPFWAPDGRAVAFFAGSALKRVDLGSGQTRIIVENLANMSTSGAWSADGTIVLQRAVAASGLSRVSADGGSLEPVTTVPEPYWGHMSPSFLPDGRRFLFFARDWTRSPETSEGGIYLGSLDSSDVRRLLPDHTNAVYAPSGHLLFHRAGELMAVPFDADAGTVTGDAVRLDERVEASFDSLSIAISIAHDGTIAIGSPGGTGRSSLQWLDRAGESLTTVSDPALYAWPSVSPDGTRIAVAIGDQRATNTDIWLLDSATGARTRLTSSPAWEGVPIWSPDGTRVTYATNEYGLDDVYVRDIQGGQAVPLVVSENDWWGPSSWSRDGRFLLLDVRGPDDIDMSVWSTSDQTLLPFLTGPANEEKGVFSPDGRFVAYTSGETGRREVFVATFPTPAEKWQVTTEGAQALSWREDGNEILIATVAGDLAAVSVSIDGGFRTGPLEVLVSGLGPGVADLAATADHSRFLAMIPSEPSGRSAEIRLLFGWAEALQEGRLTTQR